MTQTNLSVKEKQNPVDTENRPVAATGSEVRPGWSGRSALADASFYIQDG